MVSEITRTPAAGLPGVASSLKVARVLPRWSPTTTSGGVAVAVATAGRSEAAVIPGAPVTSTAIPLESSSVRVTLWCEPAWVEKTMRGSATSRARGKETVSKASGSSTLWARTVTVRWPAGMTARAR